MLAFEPTFLLLSIFLTAVMACAVSRRSWLVTEAGIIENYNPWADKSLISILELRSSKKLQSLQGMEEGLNVF